MFISPKGIIQRASAQVVAGALIKLQSEREAQRTAKSFTAY